MAKAEVIAIERFPISAMLEDEGYQPSGDLSTFTGLGDPVAVATLLVRRREKDKPGTQNEAVLDRNYVVVSPDSKTMTFSLRQQINVQKPEGSTAVSPKLVKTIVNFIGRRGPHLMASF
jgi:hypothetical protein